MTIPAAPYVPAGISGATFQAIARRKPPDMAVVYDPEIEGCFRKMPASLSGEVRPSLRAERRASGYPDPLQWGRSATKIKVEALASASEAAIAAGVPVSGVASLDSAAALDALLVPYDAGDWSAGHVCFRLSAIITFHRLVHGTTAALASVRHSYWKKQPKKQRCGSEASVEDYLAAAVALEALADTITGDDAAAGWTLLRDAALLAFAAETNLRRGAYGGADVAATRFFNEDCVRVAQVTIGKRFVKTGHTRLAVARDPRAVRLLERIIGDRRAGPLFPKSDGGRLTGDGVYDTLRRSTMRTLGFVTCPNALRDAGASSSTCLEESARRLDNDPRTARKHYRRPMFLVGLELNRTSTLIDAPAPTVQPGLTTPSSAAAASANILCTRVS